MTAALRKGDVVSVKGVVLSEPWTTDEGTRVQIRVEPYNDIYVVAADVRMVRPEFQVGDMVAWCHPTARNTSGRVMAIANDHLWVDRGDGNFATVWAQNATRLAGEPEQPKREVITHVHTNIVTDRELLKDGEEWVDFPGIEAIPAEVVEVTPMAPDAVMVIKDPADAAEEA